MMESVDIHLILPEEQADALAEMVKRFSWVDARQLAADEQEARLIIDAVITLQAALRGHGFAPR